MITWTIETNNISDLKGYDKNPRSLSEKEKRQLSDSLHKFGLIDKPVVNADNVVIGGNQRIMLLLERGAKKVDCWVPDRLLNEEEVEELNVRLNLNSGSWDYDILGNLFDVGDLITWGFDEEDLGLGKEEKPKKTPKPVISLEFCDKDTMMEYMQQCEEIAQSSSAKLKIRG